MSAKKSPNPPMVVTPNLKGPPVNSVTNHAFPKAGKPVPLMTNPATAKKK